MQKCNVLKLLVLLLLVSPLESPLASAVRVDHRDHSVITVAIACGTINI